MGGGIVHSKRNPLIKETKGISTKTSKLFFFETRRLLLKYTVWDLGSMQ